MTCCITCTVSSLGFLSGIFFNSPLKKVIKMITIYRGEEEITAEEVEEIHSMREIEGWENG